MEQQLAASIGAERARAGLGGLRDAADLDVIAGRQAQAMAEAGAIFHNPRLATDVAGYLVVGENVGIGPSAGVIHAAFMASPTHRAEILDRQYREIGVGVFDDGSHLWACEVFRLAGASSAPVSTPQPAAARPAPTRRSIAFEALRVERESGLLTFGAAMLSRWT